jgi:hypothetical protein
LSVSILSVLFAVYFSWQQLNKPIDLSDKTIEALKNSKIIEPIK